ncbi:MAG: alkaline phosphatase [Pseudomonas sp.]|nr:alkaline phosphatase [Pseudomonas sp.]
MEINTPTVGPIVGHTTSQDCRIFLRSDAAITSIPHFAVIRYRAKGSVAWSEPVFNRLMPSNDMTAVVLLQALQDDTVYDYQAGWFSANASLDSITLQSRDKLTWPEIAYSFKTASIDPRAERNFIIGSFRYLQALRGAGNIPARPDPGDQVFKVMVHKITRQRMPIDMMFMVGDPMHANDINLANPAVAQQDLFGRYRIAFSQEGLGKMMNNVPTYMILHDHDLGGNLPSKAALKNKEALYPTAIKVYSIYQASHSPLFCAKSSRDISGSIIPKKFWYTVANGVSDWFVMDTRTERNMQAQPKKILGDTQMSALLTWLKNSQARVKFVVTPVVFYPDLKSDHADSWKSFPGQRNQILEFIRLNKIKNVVFVSGDVDCSLAAKLTHSTDPDFSVHTLISSPLFKIPSTTTYAYAHKSDFILKEPISVLKNGHYSNHLISHVHSEDNFAHISADEKEVRVQFFGKNGDALEKQQVVIPLK